MSDWAKDQEADIARRVLAEKAEKRQAGMHMDPHRVEWAEWVLSNQRAEQPQPETAS